MAEERIEPPVDAPRLDWTQAQCEACWFEHESEWRDGALVSARVPVRFVPDDPTIEQCAWCGCPTIVGIYVRVDPTTVPYPRAKADDEQ